MVILTGENLGKRQQHLNKQVHDVDTRKDDFEKIKMEPNSTDPDVLFKIDVASKYKNVDYILDILKGGDTLYISRALKCTWLYDDEYSNVINVDYLHLKIFPYMSFKMQRKFLTTISMYVKNEDRAENYYTYCTNEKLHNVASKFLIFTSESFKIEVIKGSFDSILHKEEVFYKHFVGNSFTLATAIMEKASEYLRSEILYYLRYLISASENDYLDLLEKYDCPEKVKNRFGLRISTNVLKKHRSRFLEHPLLYVARLNKDLISKYINVDDAKIVLGQILPAHSQLFWGKYGKNFCQEYYFLLKKIPTDEKFQFVKNLFHSKYKNEDFEMSLEFLRGRFYDLLMTVDEREAWALHHIDTDIQNSHNYLWYEHVNFQRAFPEIKKVILITPDLHERHNVVQVLVKSVRNLTDMKTLLTYYYDRHVNEAQYYKEQFVSEIIHSHNVFEFDNDCWTALNKLLHSMKVYKISGTCGCRPIMYMAVMYHIIHNIDLPKSLKKYILEHDMHNFCDRRPLDEKLSKEKLEQVYQYIVKVYIDEITALSNVEHQDDIKIEPYVKRYVRFLETNKKSPDDCPDFIKQFVETNWNYFQHVSLFKKNKRALTQADLMRQLKQDSKVVVDNLPEIIKKISKCQYPLFKINSFLKKLKVYFPNDITKDYLKCFMETLTEEDISSASICTVVYGIFKLADDQTKIDFMAKYVPTKAKIEHGEIDERLLRIQEGICRSVCFSRPPVPLSNVLKYITGDYLRFCLPMFQSYQAKLPQPLLQEFVVKLIESPVSIQKHALRLAFECLSIENLKKTIYDSWKRNKNISIRYVLYQLLCKKIQNEDESIQVELFEVLKKITSELKDDDNLDLYKKYMHDVSILPENLRGEYIMICWQTVCKFPDEAKNFEIKQIVIDNIIRSLHLLDGNFVKVIVEDHVKHMLIDKNIRFDYRNRALQFLYEAKWKLVATYIIYFSSDSNFVQQTMNLVRSIMNKCVEMWHEIIDETFIFRKFCWKFIDQLIGTSTNKCCADAIPIFETILTVLQDSIAVSEIYRTFWSLKLTLLRRKAKQAIKVNYYSTRNPDLLALVRLAVVDYGIRVGKLVKEYVDLKSYCVSMNETIGELIKDNINDIIYVDIDDKGESYYESLKDIDILAAKGLTEVPCAEAYLLALFILPKDSNSVDYAKIIKKIKYFGSVEVQTCWYNKFVYSDFKKRRLD